MRAHRPAAGLVISLLLALGLVPSVPVFAATLSSTTTVSAICGCGGPCSSAPLLVRPGPENWAVLHEGRLHAIESRTATQAADRFAQEGKLACGPGRDAELSGLRSIVGAHEMHSPVQRPVLAPQRGVSGYSKQPSEYAYARVLDLASLRTANEDELPITVQSVGWVSVPGGSVYAQGLVAVGFGLVRRVYGPVLRLGQSGDAQKGLRPSVPASVGHAAALRVAIDEAGPVPDSVAFDVAGVGAWRRPLQAWSGPREDRSGVGKRLAVAHGVAAGFGAASILLTIFREPECKVLCDNTPPLGIDASYLRRFNRRSRARVQRDQKIYLALDLSLAGLSLLSTLIPSARHGVLSRWEILEDALILSEGVVVAYTSPLSMEGYMGRARPISFHPELGPETSARRSVGPAFMAFGANRAGAWLGGVLSMLIVEEAYWGYTLGAGLTLGAMAVASAYYEVQAGLAYPTDAPLSVLYGAINGAGTFMWHRWFWGGWPGEKTGDLPLRLRGVGLSGTRGGAAVSARLVF